MKKLLLLLFIALAKTLFIFCMEKSETDILKHCKICNGMVRRLETHLRSQYGQGATIIQCPRCDNVYVLYNRRNHRMYNHTTTAPVKTYSESLTTAQTGTIGHSQLSPKRAYDPTSQNSYLINALPAANEPKSRHTEFPSITRDPELLSSFEQIQMLFAMLDDFEQSERKKRTKQ